MLPREHRRSAEHTGVSRGHDRGGHGAQSEEGDEVRRQVLQHHRQDHRRLVGGQLAVLRQGSVEVGLIPCC